MTAWAIIRRFWWIAPLVILSFIVLWQRADISGKAADLKVAAAQNADLTKANKHADDVIASFKQQRIDNDAIAQLVADKIKVSNVRETNYQTTIERIATNEPQVRDWRAVPVPDSVRRALLQTGRSDPGTP